MEIIWSPQSVSDIETIGDFIAEDSPARASDFVDELIDSVERLKSFPESGSIVRENPVFRQVIKEGYRIIYLLKVEKIYVVSVLGPGKEVKV